MHASTGQQVCPIFQPASGFQMMTYQHRRATLSRVLAGEANAAEQAQAGLDLALRLLHLWCTAGKAELALAWISALIGDRSGMQRLPAAADSRMTLGALFEGARPACGAFCGADDGRRFCDTGPVT